MSRWMTGPAWPQVLALCVGVSVTPLLAQEHSLGEVHIKATQSVLGVHDSASAGEVSAQSLRERPLLRPAEVLETVPGMVVTQHSGDGKASQYFLRGFNLDHGTDFAIHLDGMPLNLSSHGHAQGYANLNVLIPEMLSGLRFRKGPYDAGDGDFSLSGNARLDHVNTLERPFVQSTAGPHGYRRAVLGGSRSQDERHWLGAVELLGNDGPWDNPQAVRKVNVLLRHSQATPARGLSLTLMLHHNEWNSTDQIPQREVDAGRLSRWGAMDSTDGGRSSRVSLSAQWHEQDARGRTEINAYAIRSDLNLWSNFTYNLSRSTKGDQFEQADGRWVMGAGVRRELANPVAGLDGLLTLGANWRGDRAGEVGLYLTQARLRDTVVRQDRLSQDMVSLYGQQMLQLHPQWRGTVGLRLDSLHYRVRGQEAVYGARNSGGGQTSLWQPKAGLVWQNAPQQELYANAGVGFHSNDVRGATITVDPQTGSAANRVPALVRGKGAELGWRLAPSPDFSTSVSLWTLRMGSELVFVGDAGTTEAGRPSRRTGLELNGRWKLARDWTMELNWAQSRARFVDEPDAGEGNWVDNAVNRVVSAGLTWQRGVWQAGAQVRHMGPRALNTLGTVMSEGSTLLNARIGYLASPRLTLGLEIFNLTNQRSNDIEYHYASCTAAEASAGQCGSSGIEDRHIHPIEPRTLRLTARWSY